MIFPDLLKTQSQLGVNSSLITNSRVNSAPSFPFRTLGQLVTSSGSTRRQPTSSHTVSSRDHSGPTQTSHVAVNSAINSATPAAPWVNSTRHQVQLGANLPYHILCHLGTIRGQLQPVTWRSTRQPIQRSTRRQLSTCKTFFHALLYIYIFVLFLCYLEFGPTYTPHAGLLFGKLGT